MLRAPIDLRLCLLTLLLACDGGDGGNESATGTTGETGETGETGAPPAVTWTKVAEAAGSPSARTASGLAYDEDRGVVVLHGGVSAGLGLADTWEWDGDTWTEVSDAGGPQRSGHAMAWDPVSRQVILFDGSFGADTWAFDGAAWTELAPETSPPGRSYSAMTTDGARNRIVLFGGLILTGTSSDTWEWDGATWIERDLDPRPVGRGSHAMAFDASRDEIVIVGGQTADYAFSTWAFDGETWEDRTQVIDALTSPRQGLVAGYHADLGGVVFHGGLLNTAGITGSDTWLWDSAKWTRLEPASDPGAHFYHAMIAEPMTGGVLLVDSAGGTWRLSAG